MSETSNPSTDERSTKNERGEKPISSIPEKMMRGLMKIGFLSYSLSGWVPNKVSWDMSGDQMEKLIMRYAKQWLGDEVVDVKIFLGSSPKENDFKTYVLIPKNSSLLYSNELSGENMAIHKRIPRYSPKLKEFMNRFCTKKNQRIHYDPESSEVGILIETIRILRIEFDDTGIEFGKIFGGDYKKKVEIEIHPVWEKLTEAEKRNGRKTRFKYFRIMKTQNSKTNLRSNFRETRSGVAR